MSKLELMASLADLLEQKQQEAADAARAAHAKVHAATTIEEINDASREAFYQQGRAGALDTAVAGIRQVLE